MAFIWQKKVTITENPNCSLHFLVVGGLPTPMLAIVSVPQMFPLRGLRWLLALEEVDEGRFCGHTNSHYHQHQLGIHLALSINTPLTLVPVNTATLKLLPP